MTRFRYLSLSFALAIFLGVPQIGFADEAAVKRGEYIFYSSGCLGCHTDSKNKGPRLAGGHALKTPFGTFFGPNITPDKEHGIGAWSDADFIQALQDGKSPKGQHYFPVFPYTSFTKMTEKDMLDLKAYLFAQPAIDKPNIPHEIKFPFGWRFLMLGWKILFFESGEFQKVDGKPDSWNRGAYLAEAQSHCGECHTPRNIFGGAKSDLQFAGTLDGPDGELVPNITPDDTTGVGKWSAEDLSTLLASGELPWGDDVTGSMEEVIEGTSRMTDADRRAIVEYLRDVPAIHRKLIPPKK